MLAFEYSEGFEKFTDFSFRMVTMSTLGYGNIIPINGYGIFLTIAQTLIALFFLVVILEYLVSFASKSMQMKNNSKRNPISGILATVAIISLCITFISLCFTYRNNELVNRPFVSIENVSCGFRIKENKATFFSGFETKNYGNKPAEDFTRKNIRLIILSLDNKNFINKFKQENKDTPPDPNTDSLFNYEKRKFYSYTTELLSNYFYDHPHATKAETEIFVKEKLPEKVKMKHNNKSLVKYIYGNNDMTDDFKTKLIVYPNHKEMLPYYQQPVSKKRLEEGLETGDNFLVLYWIVEYKGQVNKFLKPFTPNTYSTCYVGYYTDFNLRKIDSAGRIQLREFKSWTRTN